MEKYPPHKNLTGEQRRALATQLVDRYRAGASIRTLATECGRGFATVRAMLLESGVTLRSRGGYLGR